MQAKKDLARRIVADFHSAEAAAKAGDDWAKQFQKDEVPESIEEVQVSLTQVKGERSPSGAVMTIRLDILLVLCGLAESITEAARKLKQGAVRVNNQVDAFSPRIPLPVPVVGQPWKLTLRVGKRMKAAIIPVP